MKDFDYVIREYLVHSGYQESFMALDKENQTNLDDTLKFETTLER